MKTHTKKEALGTTRLGTQQASDGSGSMSVQNGKMPKKHKATPIQNPALQVGDSEAGLGPMPWRKAY